MALEYPNFWKHLFDPELERQKEEATSRLFVCKLPAENYGTVFSL